MRALHVVSHDGPSDLRLVDVPQPVEPPHATDPGAGITIRVRAAAVSVPDLLLTYGRYQEQPPLPFVPGSQIAGTVLSAPPHSELAPGDAVAAYAVSGGMAEVAVASPALTFPIPDGWSFADGSTYVVNYHTAYFGLVTRGGYTPGETVLVHGAAGAVGSACVQVAAAMGARVIAVASNDSKAAACRRAGAHEVFLADGWKDQVLAIHPAGVDIVLDPVGGDRALDNTRVLAESGRWVVVGFASGQIPEVRLNRFLLRNIAAVGASWGAYAFSKASYVSDVERALRDLVVGGGVRPLVGAVYPLERAVEAFQHAEGRSHLGNVVIDL